MEPTGGALELVPDPDRPTGRTLLADGVARSYVDLADPRHLHFEYVRRMATVLDLAAPAGLPLHALHLGGGALTLPRYLAATRPGSTQLVVERDPAVVELVRRELPALPAGVGLRLADARMAVADAPPAGYDVVCLIAGRRMLGGRRYGNVVLAAAHRAGRLPLRRLADRLARDPVPGEVRGGAALTAFVAGARPLSDPTG